MSRVRFMTLVAVVFVVCCAPTVRRTGSGPPSAAEMAEFWIDPGPSPRDLSRGPGEVEAVPAADARYEILKRDTGGFSITYRVRDDARREWSVKIGPEARPEVVSARIVWAVGYHEVPSYFVERWIGVEHGTGEMQGGSRFRPHHMPLKSEGTWSWQRNPFVGTRPYNGLLVLMMILNSTDLKNENNELYRVVGEPREGARQWYVIKDLGASLGETGRMDPRRDYLQGFEREPFITGVSDGHVRFGFRGRHQELLQSIGVDDVRWMCERLRKITDRQWRDAFQAGGYTAEETTGYVTRIRQKIDQGLALR